MLEFVDNQNRHRHPVPNPIKEGLMKDDVCERLGANIRAYRTERGWTLYELSKLLGVSYQQVQKYEKGTNRMPITMVVVTSKLFGCSLDELCGFRVPELSHATAALMRRLSCIQSPALQEMVVALLEILEKSEFSEPRNKLSASD